MIPANQVDPKTPNDVAAHIGNARGARAFLKWVEAALPAAISGPVLAYAAGLNQNGKNLSGLGITWRTRPFQPPSARPLVRALSGYGGGLGAMGDGTSDAIVTAFDFSSPDVTSSITEPNFTVTADQTGATDSPPSSSWLSSIGSALSSAISAAGQAYLTVSQVNTANKIVNTNLQLAAQGKPLINATPAQLGLTGPTLNVGLSSTTQNALLWLGGGLLLVVLLGGMARQSRR